MNQHTAEINSAKPDSPKIIKGEFDFTDGKLSFTCHTNNVSFDEVLQGITALRDELDRQINNQQQCPFHPLNKKHNNNMKKFITYTAGSDTQLFATIDGDKKTITQNEFHFTGFSNEIHPYYRRRYNRIVEILASAGIVLNVAEVKTVDQMSSDIDEGQIGSVANMHLPKQNYKESHDGNVYIVFQDTEMGRGWAALIKNSEILSQEHRDIVWNELEEGTFIRSFGIDYKVETVKDLDAVLTEYRS